MCWLFSTACVSDCRDQCNNFELANDECITTTIQPLVKLESKLPIEYRQNLKSDLCVDQIQFDVNTTIIIETPNNV